MSQKGSPWHNEDIYRITVALDSALRANKLSSKIIIGEAGILTSLYSGRDHADKQIQYFYARDSKHNIRNLSYLKPIIEGHSYFTDDGDTNIVNVRVKLKDTAVKYKVPFWQSEYSMLGNGYKEGKEGNVSAMDCALFLAKMIHNDLTVANAAAWHLWNAWEPSRSDSDTRYCLLPLCSNTANTQGTFIITKNLWSLGHYSRFVRPGMKRIVTQRNDGINDLQAAKDIMLSAFANRKQLVSVAINYTAKKRVINLYDSSGGRYKSIKQYVTTADKDENMKPSIIHSLLNITLPARSISTIVVDL